MTSREHNRLAGIFLSIHGAVQSLIIILVCIFYGVIGSAVFIGGAQNGNGVAGLLFIMMMIFTAFVSLFFILPQLMGGYMLLKEKPNARIWGIVGSIVACLSFPFGTAAGIYGLWYLFGEQGKHFYLGTEARQQFQSPRPPEPNSWQ